MKIDGKLKQIKYESIKRYTDMEFPSFRYIPNQGIQLLKSDDKPHIPVLPDLENHFSAQSWQKSASYLYAIDLFNYGYYWEVHEVLEKLWMYVGKKSPEGILYKELFKFRWHYLKICNTIHKG
jgi:uncharacterized protein